MEVVMSSADYQSLINSYTSVQVAVNGLYSYLGNCSYLVGQCIPLAEIEEIGGEPIDKGDLGSLSDKLEKLKGAFNTIVAECEYYINYYTELRNAALIAEEEAKKNATNDSD